MSTPVAAAEPLPFAPAPWLMEGSGWVIPIYTPFSTTPIPLPEGSYAPFEAGSSADMSDRFHGGVGMVLILRYSNTDVGPYDELILIPGLFSNTHKGAKEPSYDLAITRIVVSSDRSTVNGRREWGMPKHRGVFSFTSTPSGHTTITVAHPTSPSTPYFRTTLRSSWATPLALPVSTSWLSFRAVKPLLAGYATTLVQRALPSASAPSAVADEKREQAQQTGQRLEAFVPSLNAPGALRVNFSAKGRARLATVEEKGQWETFGDGVGFPRVRAYAPRASFRFESFRMDLEKAVEVQLE
ncbi:hypothetical protein JCM10450v2_004034 [Rhodotorula kratochvilovae]